MVTFLITFLCVQSSLTLAIPRNAIGFEFSRINMTLFGCVAVALVTVVGDRFEADPCRHLLARFLTSVWYVAAHTLPVFAASADLELVVLAIAVSYAPRGSTQRNRFDKRSGES